MKRVKDRQAPYLFSCKDNGAIQIIFSNGVFQAQLKVLCLTSPYALRLFV